MTFDAAGLNRRVIREALEFVAANRDQIARATAVASSSPTKRVLNETGRVRAQLAGAADRASQVGLRSAEMQTADRAAAQADYVRRAVAPLGVDQLTRELAWVLRSDSTLGAKLVATDIVREQAELRAGRESRRVADHAVAQRLLAQARRTLDDAQTGRGDVESRPDYLEQAAPGETMPPAGTDVPSEDGQVGIDDLIAAIQEEGEKTRETLREESKKTRDTIKGAAKSTWRTSLLLGLAALLVSLASFYLQAQGPSPTPRHASGAASFKAQGPVAPPAAGPPGGRLRLGPPAAIRPHEVPFVRQAATARLDCLQDR